MQKFEFLRQPLLGELAMSRKKEKREKEKKMTFIVATYVYASSQGERTHSARTKILLPGSLITSSMLLWLIHYHQACFPSQCSGSSICPLISSFFRCRRMIETTKKKMDLSSKNKEDRTFKKKKTNTDITAIMDKEDRGLKTLNFPGSKK